ncbi:hypothetical protein AR505_0342 [methanogenic archaeon ISO4-H5]|nr:hypothetical protein AR505_0342 [methanogenic archaeon ISO4-H5]
MNPDEYALRVEECVEKVQDLFDDLGLPCGTAIDVLINSLIDECSMKEDLDEAEVDDILLTIADGIEETTGIGNSVICPEELSAGDEGCCGSCDCCCHGIHDVTDRELDEDFDDMEGK